MITPNDVKTADFITNWICGAFITGSFLVDRKTANDIDVVVGCSAWGLFRATNGQPSYLSQIEIDGVNFELQENEDDSGERYGDSENEMFELAEHWRGGGVNILVIRDIFIAAYRAASYALEANPAKHLTREARIDTHQKMKGVIREMLYEASQ